MLPLRLAAEPVCRARLGNCFVLPSKDDDERVCMIVGEAGLLALALAETTTGAPDDEALARALGIDVQCLPCQRVVVNGAKSSWTGQGKHRDAVAQQCDCSDAAHAGCLVPQRIVEGIHRYYARQVLEPSIRGFLSILEKQFPRNDLYLFELLQNAVDDGASIVSFATTRDGLEFTHNGKRFTALDVLGLASVGLSTKGSDGTGPKRTIGFMGVGFKAVYKRYSRVVIGDDRYGFAFKEQQQQQQQQQQQVQASSTMPGHGWVMMPVWTGPVQGSKSGPQAGWCRFLLEAPRGGVASVAADIRTLPRTVVPLLGRQSLENAGTAEWTLEWDGARHRVSRPVKAAARDMGPGWFAGSESLDVETSTGSATGSGFSSQQQQHQRTATTRWQFVTLRFSPDEFARKAYETHIKRPWVGGGSGPGAQCEETCLFFELDAASGIPVCSAKGNVHAVLPTKLSLPCPLQWQGSWLLSVDRQEVQSVFDNDWNACLLKQAPKLLASLLSWLVGASADPRLHSPAGLRAVFYLFPQMERGSSSSSSSSPSLSSFLLGQRITMQPLADYMASNAVVPVRRRDGSLGWLPATKVVWLPPPLVTRMPAAMLERWMGLLPLATDALCDGTAYLPLWRHCLTFPRQLAKTRSSARDALRLDGAGLSSLHAAISLMAAFGEVISVDVDKAATLFMGAASRPKAAQPPSTAGAKADKADGKEDGAQLCGSWLPPLAEWPIFFTERGTELTASEVVWLSEDFATLPPDVLRLLRDGALLVCQDRAREGGGGGAAGVRALLEPNIEMFVLTGSLPPRAAVVSPWRLDDAQHAALDGDKTLLPACRALFAACREAHATCVVSPVEACAGLLGKYAHTQARGAPLSAAELAACEALFLWAFSSGLPQALTHVLAGQAPSAPKLVPAAEAYLDSCYLPEAAWLQGLVNGSGTPALQLVSAQYLQRAGGDRAAVCRFLLEAGVRRGLALYVTSRSLSPAQLSALSIAPPKLRSKNSAAPLSLPFNLGGVSKNKLYEVDAALSAEWTSILSGKLSPAQAASVVESVVAAVKQAEAADPATPEAVPAAANLLRGKEEQSTCVRTAMIPPGFDHRCYLPTKALAPLLKRLYFLPPGQAGGSALSLGLASFVRSLAVLRWIPCAAPGAPAEAPASLVCPPSECVLDASSGAATDMPTVRLPPALAKALSQLPAVVLKEFAFGSVKPRPPVDKLEALAAEAERVDRQGAPDAQADEHLFFELVGVWRAIGAALREGRLSTDEQRRVMRVCQAGCAVLPTSPESPRRRVSLGRVVALAAPSADLKDDELAAAALVKVGFLLNLREPAYALDAGLCLLLRPSSAVSADACCDFLSDLFLRVLPKMPGGPSAPAPGPALKRAISWAMWVGMRPLLGAGASAAPSPAIRAAFVKKVPGLSVFCRRGPGFSPQAYPARWLPIGPVDAAASAQTQPMGMPVLPVLTDDEAASGRKNGVSKAAMLLPSHAYQPLGMLDHALSRERDAETTRLTERERVVLAVLGIPQTSAADQFSLKTTVSGKGEALPGPSKRLEIVVLLLSTLKAGAGNFDGSLSAMQMPALTRYQSIALVFKTPRMAEPERRSVFAVWGAGASAASLTRALFIAASPEDYVAELEGLVLALVYGPSSAQQGASERPTKVLRLLSFLEDEEKFLKFLHRDFGAFIPAEKDHGVQPEEATRGDSGAAKEAEQGKDEGKDERNDEGKDEREKEGREGGKEGSDGADEAARLHGQLRASILSVFLDKQQRERERERERGRRDDKRPAQALSLADEASPLDPAKRSRPSDSPPATDAAASSAFGAQAAAVLADAFLSRLTASVPSGRGRGGVSNLPAWMTEPGRSLLITSQPSVPAPEPGSPKSAPPQQGQFDDQEEEGEERQAKGADAAVSPSAAAAALLPGRPAGRGLAATLPAWMTASTALGQEQEWSQHTRGLGDRLLQKFGISGPAPEPASDPASVPSASSSSASSSSSSSSTSAQTAPEEAAPSEASSQQLQQQGDKRKAEAAAPDRQKRGRTNEAASRQLIDRLAAFISELQRALSSSEVEVEWAKELLASAIEQLTS